MNTSSLILLIGALTILLITLKLVTGVDDFGMGISILIVGVPLGLIAVAVALLTAFKEKSPKKIEPDKPSKTTFKTTKEETPLIKEEEEEENNSRLILFVVDIGFMLMAIHFFQMKVLRFMIEMYPLACLVAGALILNLAISYFFIKQKNIVSNIIEPIMISFASAILVILVWMLWSIFL